MAAGKEFARNKIKESFLCVQLRLLDGQFKNHRKATFSTFKEKLKTIELGMKGNKANGHVHIFIMTDLPQMNWTNTYLVDVVKDGQYKLYTLQESDELVW
jgi:hypothetical protein